MVMVVFVVSGNWRTWSLSPAIAPMSRISRLTTLESTGRRMKRSVKAFIASPSQLGRCGHGRQRRRRLDGHRRLVLELDLAGGDDLLARLEAGEDADALAAGVPELDQTALDHHRVGDARRRRRRRRRPRHGLF